MDEAPILFDVADGWGIVTLNRPERLNALSLTMCAQMAAKLSEWREDDAVHAVLVKAAGERAFCAGGDIRDLYEQRMAGDVEGPMRFFATEYLNNWRVAHFPKPYVAFIDGAVMGGGVGISILGEFRVVTENALFAMPECGIGLYPDVGATHMLPRLRGEVGMWLGLTGTRLGAGDTVHMAIATHAVRRNQLDEVEVALRGIGWGEDPHGQVSRLLDGFHVTPPGETPALDRLGEINAAFALDGVQDILEALRRDGGAWQMAQVGAIERGSPLSVRVTHRAIRRGAKQDMTEALIEEHALTRQFVQDSDLMEGIRAQVIDKDRAPKWRHAHVSEVTKAEVDAMFAPAPELIRFGWEETP